MNKHEQEILLELKKVFDQANQEMASLRKQKRELFEQTIKTADLKKARLIREQAKQIGA